jgi:hypothetical protein
MTIFTTIFTFGSNLAGRHGAGSAKEAVDKWGAEYGNGVGLQGNSYAIPTKDKNLKTLPLDEIKKHVDEFLAFAKLAPDVKFLVCAIGTGLAGYNHQDIAPMFKTAPPNCELPEVWVRMLQEPEASEQLCEKAI